MPDRTPYNSLYEPFKGQEEASPSIKKTPVRKICCVHGAPCQIARNSNKVDREKNFEEALHELAKGQRKENQEDGDVTNSSGDKSVSSKKDKKKKKHKKEQKYPTSSKYENSDILNQYEIPPPLPEDSSNKKMKKRNPDKKESESSTDNQYENLSSFQQTSDLDDSAIRRRRKRKERKERKERERKEREETSVKGDVSGNNDARHKEFKMPDMKDQTNPDLPALGAYLGACSFVEAEQQVEKKSDFRLYHQLPNFTGLDDLEQDLPLMLVYRTAQGTYRHYPIRTRRSEKQVHYYVEYGSNRKGSQQPSLGQLVRYYQNNSSRHPEKIEESRYGRIV